MDAELAGEVERRLLRFTGQEEVVAGGGGLGEVPPPAAGHDSRPLDRVGPVREHERLSAELLAHAADEALGLGRRPQRPAEADSGELLLRLDPELLRHEDVVADLGMRVQREVVRGERHVGVEERLEPLAHRARRCASSRCPTSRPWWTMRSCASSSAARWNSASEAETPQAILLTSSAPWTCMPIGP